MLANAQCLSARKSVVSCCLSRQCSEKKSCWEQVPSSPGKTPSDVDLEARLQAALTDAGHWRAEAQRLSAARTTAAAEEQLAAGRVKAEAAAAVAAAVAAAECVHSILLSLRPDPFDPF